MIEWKNDGRTAIINEWWFHFDDMYALHGTDWTRGRRTLVQKWVDSHEIGGVRDSDRYDYSPVGMRRACGHNERDWNGNDIWYAFFMPPEDHFNDMIQEAYQIYLLEKALKDSNSDHNPR